MNFELIGHLIRLRYKLLWAKTRSRNGRIALFVTGYLIFILAVAVAAIFGAGGGMAAVRLGKAEVIVQGVLTSLFVFALFTAVMLGFGMNEIFSDTELRRYPLKERERRFARHFTGAVDPYWLLFFVLNLGMAAGVYLFGVGSLLLGLTAVLLLFVCNYLAARVLGLTLDRIMQQKGGSILLPLLFVGLCLAPSALAPVFARNKALREMALQILSYTPTFGAGTLMTRTDAAALWGFGLVVWWILGLAAALVFLERRPPRPRTVRKAALRWDTPFDRVGALFGAQYGPLVTHWLQFLFRCKRFRLTYLMSLPLLPFLLLMWSRQSAKANPFSTAVGVFAIAGMAPASSFIVNQFGYLRSGFRRYFLFPIDPGAALRASSYALISLCSVYVALAAACWALFAPVPLNARGFIMLLASGVFGLFAFHGAGLWTSLYGARRCDPDKTMGNDLSLAGNLVVVGGMLLLLLGPLLAGQFRKDLIVPEHWWAMVALAALAASFYFASLRRAAAILSSRRERLLAVVEGKA